MPCRSGESSAANVDLAELVADLGAEDRAELLVELLFGPARMYMISGSTIR